MTRPRPRLGVVVPHWPLDEEVNAALEVCLATLPGDCEKIVVVNQGTGFAVNVNIGLRLASGEYVAVVTNASRVEQGDVYDLCVPETVTSPRVGCRHLPIRVRRLTRRDVMKRGDGGNVRAR